MLGGDLPQLLSMCTHSVGLCDGITVGEKREQRLQWAGAMVCLVTSAYVASVWCAAEVGAARAGGSRLLPVQAEPGVDHPLFRAIQLTDLTRDAAAARAA